MNRIGRVVMILGCCCLAVSCASAPISLAGNASDRGAVSPAEASLADATTQLTDTYRERGWIRDASATSGALGWMNRLAGQADAEDVAATPVDHYLDQAGVSVTADGFAAGLAADIRDAEALAADVDLAAASLVASADGASRAELDRALGDVETAITRSREALDLFDSLVARVETGSASTEALLTVRQTYAVRTEALRDRADELAALRHGARASGVS